MLLTQTSFACSVSELWFADGRLGAATSAPSAGGEGWTSWSPGFQSTIPSWCRQGVGSGRPSALVLLREALPAAGRGAGRRQPAGHRALPHRGNGSVTSLPEAPFLGRPRPLRRRRPPLRSLGGAGDRGARVPRWVEGGGPAARGAFRSARRRGGRRRAQDRDGERRAGPGRRGAHGHGTRAARYGGEHPGQAERAGGPAGAEVSSRRVGLLLPLD